MHLRIDSEVRDFIPVKDFRAAFDLPLAFGVSLFEPKDYTDLGHIDHAGGDLNIIRQAMLEAMPSQMPLLEWLLYIPHLSGLLRSKLHEINPEIGLKTVEIEYAVSGFQDVCQNLIYAMIRTQANEESRPEFQQVYESWLDQTVRISTPAHSYIHKGNVWAVQIVNTIFGRFGLIVWMDEETFYVHDNNLACPAEGFMYNLTQEVARRIMLANDTAQLVSSEQSQ